ncbi:hypothetical protein PLICRDRAFT_180697 [Plicaturopsis crispa FD-325 SS-3]|uniref:Unplaced genomic scaffold PLICRscaffold_29, whole genome shotgun sequence n=1 Tax=Plicaturopsis crispa FD-325 SS-3 TaxID=944288 RepID=A0A0C9T4T6_PLICR|nr:hypothetical protein PLICRDRAFT_180697 [Plicaturopsis crispa FD-325 SS-3]
MAPRKQLAGDIPELVAPKNAIQNFMRKIITDKGCTPQLVTHCTVQTWTDARTILKQPTIRDKGKCPCPDIVRQQEVSNAPRNIYAHVNSKKADEHLAEESSITAMNASSTPR